MFLSPLLRFSFHRPRSAWPGFFLPVPWPVFFFHRAVGRCHTRATGVCCCGGRQTPPPVSEARAGREKQRPECRLGAALRGTSGTKGSASRDKGLVSLGATPVRVAEGHESRPETLAGNRRLGTGKRNPQTGKPKVSHTQRGLMHRTGLGGQGKRTDLFSSP